jgi:hypothetical protein
MTNLRRIVLSSVSALTATISFAAISGKTRYELAAALLILSLSSTLIALIVGIRGTVGKVRLIARVGCAVIVAFLGLIPIEMAADSADWSAFGSHGMGEVGYFVVVPIVSVIVYYGLRRVPGLRES